MGGTLRLCKEKFYGGVHSGLRCWVAAAVDDGWDTRNVRCGPSSEKSSPVKRSPKKGPVEEAPRIDMRLDLAKTFTMLGMYDEAESEFNDILQREPENKAALENLKFIKEPV